MSQVITYNALPILHEPSRLGARKLGLLVLITGAAYGLAMGSYSLLYGNPWQAVLSAVKVPMLVLATFALSLPMFFTLMTLLNLRDAFRPLVRAIVQSQLAFTIVLCSLGPITILWSFSSSSYRGALLFNGVVFAISAAGAQVVLQRLARVLIAREPRVRWMLIAWIGVYVFVAIQMAWVLRPFVGNPQSPVQFFRQNAWGNAYVEVWNLVTRGR